MFRGLIRVGGTSRLFARARLVVQAGSSVRGLLTFAILHMGSPHSWYAG